MNRKVSDSVLREVDALVATSESLSKDAASSPRNLGPDRVEQLASVTARGGQLIRALYGPHSQHIAELERVRAMPHFSSMHSENFLHVSLLAGVMQAVQHDLKSGLLIDLRNVLAAEIFADFLDMAEHLLDEGYKDAAAVLLGATLEDSLRKLAGRNNISATAPTGKFLTMEPLNVELAKVGAYGALVKKQITSWANLRNDAAHGHFNKYDEEQVRQMLLFVQKFCADHLQ